MACHGVARQGEDGRTHLVRQVRLVRHKRHTTATRTPLLPSKKPCIPQRHIFARAIPDCGTANPRGITWRTNNPPKKSQKIPKIPIQAPHPRPPHTAVAIKKASHTPTAHLCPCHSKQRHSKPSGYHMACHGVARQGEDGRTHLVRQVRQVRHKRHTTVISFRR